MEESLVKEIPFHSLILGPTKSGKTRYLTDLLSGTFKDVFDIIILICPTFSVNDTWQEFNEKFYVMSPDSSDSYEIDECLKICKDLFYNNKKDKVLVILDDCAQSSEVKKRASKLIDLVFNGRHTGISVWILTQQLTSIAKPIRENCNYVVSFQGCTKDSEDLIFREYAPRLNKECKESILQILDKKEFSRLCLWKKKKHELQIPNVI